MIPTELCEVGRQYRFLWAGRERVGTLVQIQTYKTRCHAQFSIDGEANALYGCHMDQILEEL